MRSCNPDSAASGSGEAAEPAFRVIEGRRDAGVLLLCDHASNALPASYRRLGLDETHFERHIAYDVGAATATEAMAATLNAPALLTTYSRLLIDPNRGAEDPTLVMRISDGAVVPGNARIDAGEIDARRRRFWEPYHEAIEDHLAAMRQTGVVPAIVSMHSFTPVMKGIVRPWHVGLLWDNDSRLAQPLLSALAAEADLQPWTERVGDNEPYDGVLPGDTIDQHATRSGLANVLVEVRQDLIADRARAWSWGERLARLLGPILRRPELHRIEIHPVRSGAVRRLVP